MSIAEGIEASQQKTSRKLFTHDLVTQQAGKLPGSIVTESTTITVDETNESRDKYSSKQTFKKKGGDTITISQSKETSFGETFTTGKGKEGKAKGSKKGQVGTKTGVFDSPPTHSIKKGMTSPLHGIAEVYDDSTPGSSIKRSKLWLVYVSVG